MSFRRSNGIPQGSSMVRFSDSNTKRCPLSADMRFELGFGWTLVAPRLNTTYHSQYAPPLTPAGPYIGSSAEQTVNFKGKTSFGFNGFFNLLFTAPWTSDADAARTLASLAEVQRKGAPWLAAA